MCGHLSRLCIADDDRNVAKQSIVIRSMELHTTSSAL